MALVRSSVPTPASFFVDGGSNNTYSFPYPGGVAPANGNLVVFIVVAENRSVSSIAGTGMTFSINGATTSSAGMGMFMSQWKGIGNGTDTSALITLSGATAATAYIAFMEFDSAGADQSGSTANGGNIEGSSTSHTSGSVTPPTTTNIVVASQHRTNETWTEDGAFTMLTTGTALFAVGYMIQAAATAQSFDSTSGSNRYSITRIGAFAGSGGGGGSAIAAISHHLRHQGIN